MPEFPKHFDGKHFFYPGALPLQGFSGVLRWKLTSRPEPSPGFLDDVVSSKPPPREDTDGVRITLVNHSTVLLQYQNCNILTDPIWSERCSPVSWAGPRRHRKPGVAWGDLPRIDTVLLSHDHYDHLDLPTLRLLAARGESTFIVPAKVGRLLRSEKIAPVHELDWGESLRLPASTIHCVPAIHFSGRGISNRNETLWCGYVIELGERRVYFAGDTAFGDHFEAIRERFGSPELALLPIGAYEPRWFMSPVHMGPDEAVKAHRILGAATSIAIHHGTFHLADEGLDTPAKSLIACAGNERFLILKNGQVAEIP